MPERTTKLIRGENCDVAAETLRAVLEGDSSTDDERHEQPSLRNSRRAEHRAGVFLHRLPSTRRRTRAVGGKRTFCGSPGFAARTGVCGDFARMFYHVRLLGGYFNPIRCSPAQASPTSDLVVARVDDGDAVRRAGEGRCCCAMGSRNASDRAGPGPGGARREMELPRLDLATRLSCSSDGSSTCSTTNTAGRQGRPTVHALCRNIRRLPFARLTFDSRQRRSDGGFRSGDSATAARACIGSAANRADLVGGDSVRCSSCGRSMTFWMQLDSELPIDDGAGTGSGAAAESVTGSGAIRAASARGSGNARRRRSSMRTERDKMLAGELYDPLDPQLVQARDRARDLCQDLNATRERDQELRRSILKQLFSTRGGSVRMQPLFFSDYGFEISF